MKNYSMITLATEVGLQDRLFLTRAKGEQAYQLLRHQLEQVPTGQGLVLDFPEGQLVDASFADETILRLGEQLLNEKSSNVTLILQGLTEDSVKNIEAVISFRRLRLAFLAVEPAGKWKCIGQLDPVLRDLLHCLAECPSITAPELASRFELAINTASTRLKRLYDRRLVRRDYQILGKGIQYIYYFWDWSQELTGTNEQSTRVSTL